MKKNLIYGSIIVIGVGAIAYMYYLTDTANKNTFSSELDDALENLN
jgi:hypothetical protein